MQVTPWEDHETAMEVLGTLQSSSRWFAFPKDRQDALIEHSTAHKMASMQRRAIDAAMEAQVAGAGAGQPGIASAPANQQPAQLEAAGTVGAAQYAGV